jgi:hypothetical protein
MMTLLETLRDALATIPGVASCKIGLEANISPADYPLIRVVPTRIVDGRALNYRRAECLIYFGMDQAESENGLEAVYSALFSTESLIREIVENNGGLCIETLTDEDRLDTYKLMAVRCEVDG